MIVHGAQELELLAREVSELQRSQQHGTALANRRRLVDELLERAQAASAASTALAPRLAIPPPEKPVVDAALSAIAKWRNALDNSLSDALGGDLFGRFQDAADKAVRVLEARAADAWQRYTTENTEQVSEEVLTALSADASARPAISRIRTLSEALSLLRLTAIPTLAQVGEFDSYAAELRGAWSSLDIAGLDTEVLEFLRAVNSFDGAPLSLYSASVRDWLEQRGAVGHYAIRAVGR